MHENTHERREITQHHEECNRGKSPKDAQRRGKRSMRILSQQKWEVCT